VPTQRPRHTITETDEVQEALAPLRAHGIEVSFPALLIRGAQATLADRERADADEAERRAARERFFDGAAERFDLDAAIAVRDAGWLRR
jgi:hypothetical protein